MAEIHEKVKENNKRRITNTLLILKTWCNEVSKLVDNSIDTIEEEGIDVFLNSDILESDEFSNFELSIKMTKHDLHSLRYYPELLIS